MEGNSLLQVGNALQHKGGSVKEQILIPVRVIDIMLDINHPEIKNHGGYDAIGTIFYAEVYIKEGEDYPATLRTAKPMFQFVKQYPLKNEIVMIMSSPGTKIYETAAENASTYYLPNFNIWNHPHHNALPDMRYFGDDQTMIDDYEMVNGGLVRTVKDEDTSIPLGEYFQERLNIQPLLPFEGDTIIEGRFGNSIRFGGNSSGSREKNAYSTVGDIGDPIIIIRNGQSDFASTFGRGWEHNLEDVNDDHSSMYLMSNQKMPNIEVASTNWESWSAKHDELEVTLKEKDEFDSITIGPTPEKIIVPDPLPLVDPHNTEYTDDYEEELGTEEGMCTTCEADELSIYDDLMAQDNFEENEFKWEEYDIDMHDEEIFTKEEVDFNFGDPATDAGNCPKVEKKGTDNADFLEFRANGEVQTVNYSAGGANTNVRNDAAYVYHRKSTNYKGEVYYHGTPFDISWLNGGRMWRSNSKTDDLSDYKAAPKNSQKTHLCIHTTAGTDRFDGWPSIHRHLTSIDCKSGRPWPVGGYHWMVSPTGEVQQNYADDARCCGIGGGHASVGATNDNTIQLNWIGGSSSQWNITDKQCKGLRLLCQIYIIRYPNMKIFGHNQVAHKSKKSCPIFSVPIWLDNIGCPSKNNTTGLYYSGAGGYHKGKYKTNAEHVATKSGKWVQGLYA